MQYLQTDAAVLIHETFSSKRAHMDRLTKILILIQEGIVKKSSVASMSR